MTAPTAPFRADHVGSLKRPERLAAARRRHFEEGVLDAEELAGIEDEEIAEAVRRQQDVGLPVVTDGEFRRAFWHYDFLKGIDGIDLVEKQSGIAFQAAGLKPLYPAITGEIGFSGHPMIEHFRYLANVAKVQPKISIPAPSAAHYRTLPEDIIGDYGDRDLLFADLTAAWRDAVKAFYDAGCRYIQLDEVFIAYLCDKKIRAERKAAGDDPDRLIAAYAAMLDGAIRDRPSDMVAAMHLCRGNFRSTFVASGGYDPAAEIIFNEIDADIYFMEYDTDRAGGLEPLAALPKGRKRVMPGFITTKGGGLEDIDMIRRKFDAAAQFVDLDQLGIAPQCGFASTEEGNTISERDQWKKMELVVKVAETIWGRVEG